MEHFPGAFREAVKESEVDSSSFFLNELRKKQKQTGNIDEEQYPENELKRNDGNSLYRNITMYAEEKSCQKCKGLILKGDGEEIDLEALPSDVLNVLHKLRAVIERRRQQKTREQIDEILARVSCVLHDSELTEICKSSSAEDLEDSDTAGDIKLLTEEEKIMASIRKRKIERVHTGEMLSTMLKSSTVKRDIVIELHGWFSIVQREWEQVCSWQTNFDESGYNKENIFGMIEKFEKFEKSTDRLSTLIGDKLKTAIQEAQNIYKKPIPQHKRDEYESEDSSSSESDSSSATGEPLRSLRDEIDKIAKQGKNLTEKELLQTPEKLKDALKPIKDTLKFGKRLARSQPNHKMRQKPFTNARKQLDVITQVVEKKEKQVCELETIVVQKKSEIEVLNTKHKEEEMKASEELERLANENDELIEEVNRLQIEIATAVPSFAKTVSQILSEKLSIQNESEIVLNSELEFSEIKIADEEFLPSEITEEERKISFVGDYLSELSVKLKDSSMSKLDLLYKAAEENRKLTAENEELIIQNKNTENDLMESRRKLAIKEEEIENLHKKQVETVKETLQLADEKAILENKINQLENELAAPAKLQLELEEESIKQKSEHNYSTVDTETPKENVKTKSDDDTHKNMNTIDKTLHYQTIALLKQKWDTDVRRLRSFIINEQHRFQANTRRIEMDHKKAMNNVKTDNEHTMRSLYRFKNAIGKLLQNGEFSSDKGTRSSKSEAELSLFDKKGESERISESATEILLSLERNLKTILLGKQLKVKEANMNKVSAERDLEKNRIYLSRVQLDLKQQSEMVKSVSEKNTQLSNEYANALVTNQYLQKETAQSKSKQVPNKSGKSSPLNINFPTEEFNKTPNSVPTNASSTCKESMKLIDTIFQNNLISETDYKVASETIQLSSRISNEQFACLIVRYIKHCEMRSLKDYLVSLGKQYQEEVRFTRYITFVEERHQNTMQKLEHQKILLNQRRERIFLALGDIFLKSNQDLTIVPLSLTKQISLMKIKAMHVQKLRQGIKVRTKELDDVVGKRLETGDESNNSYWKMPSDHHTFRTLITTPKILEMDVNPWRRVVSSSKGANRFSLPPIAKLCP